MANNDKTNERLASLEAKLEFVKELLTEIRKDVKDQPTRTEFEELEYRVNNIESKQNKILVKVSTVSIVVMMVGGLLIRFFLG